jgi:DNA-binding NtrC family response regulator
MNDKPVHFLMAAGPDADGGAPCSGQHPTVLVIDTEFRRRSELSKLLAARGFTVLTACNGEEALAPVVRGGVVLVISSVVMPRMDGLELLRIMRERQPMIPVIVIASGDNAIDEVYLRGADLLGAAKSFSWPLLDSALLDCVETLLDHA